MELQPLGPMSGTPSSGDAIISLYHGVMLTEDFGMCFQFLKMKCTVATRTVITDKFFSPPLVSGVHLGVKHKALPPSTALGPG